MNTPCRTIVVATILAAGGATSVNAQALPAPTPTAPPVEMAAEGPDARIMPVHFRGVRDGSRAGQGPHGGRDDHAARRRGGPGGLLGVFGPGDGRAMLAALDGDADGAVTQAEIDAFLAARVVSADGDGDGALSLEEFEPVYVERIRSRIVDSFQALDADGSGTITSEEIDARFGDAVVRLDRDGDDALTMQDGRRRRD